jgi:hypothetical protein
LIDFKLILQAGGRNWGKNSSVAPSVSHFLLDGSKHALKVEIQALKGYF